MFTRAWSRIEAGAHAGKFPHLTVDAGFERACFGEVEKVLARPFGHLAFEVGEEIVAVEVNLVSLVGGFQPCERFRLHVRVAGRGS